MDQAKLAWGLLSQAIGSYQGEGLNHEGQKYSGFCELSFSLPSKVIALQSEAKGMAGELYHSEASWISRDLSGALVLYTNSSNHPGTTPHQFNRIEEGQDGTKKVIFRFGNLDDRNSFREEVTLAIYPDGSLEHRYAWGLPGGNFETRSGARMGKQKTNEVKGSI